MKVFIASIIILAMIIALVTLNAIYIRSIAEKICSELDKIPESSDEIDREDALENAHTASAIWHGNRIMIGITVNSTEILEIDRQFTEMMTYFQNESNDEAITAKERLAEMIDLLKRREKLSVDNIL